MIRVLTLTALLSTSVVVCADEEPAAPALPENQPAQTPTAVVDAPMDEDTKKLLEELKVRQNGNNIEVVTPYGKRMIFGDQGFKQAHDYKLEIPLDELRPPKPKTVAAPPPEPAKPERIVATEEPKPEPPAETPPKVVLEYDYSDRLVLEANRLYNRRKFYEATITVDELLTRRPDYPRGWVMKGSLMYVQGQRDLAKSAWERALELDPENAQVKQYLGRLK